MHMIRSRHKSPCTLNVSHTCLFPITDPQKWKHQSPALQKAAADFKRARLERCTTDRDRFLRFISLCDSLVLTQMCSLARAALALCLSELTQPRRVGLFLMVGCVDDAAAAAAAAAVARSAVATASAMSATQQHSAWMRQTGVWVGSQHRVVMMMVMAGYAGIRAGN